MSTRFRLLGTALLLLLLLSLPLWLDTQINKPAWQSKSEGVLDAMKQLGAGAVSIPVKAEIGRIPVKDQRSVKEYLQVANLSQEKLDNVREPAQKFAGPRFQ